MNNSIQLIEKRCAVCGGLFPLGNCVTLTKDNRIVCGKCSAENTGIKGDIYVNIGNTGYLALTDSKYIEMSLERPEPLICTDLTVCSGRLFDKKYFPKNAVIVSEILPDGYCGTPEDETVISDDHRIQRSIAKHYQDPCIIRPSRMTAREFIFLKHDPSDKEKLPELYASLKKAIAQIDNIDKRSIYMEKMTGDDDDIGKRILAESGIKAFYFTGASDHLHEQDKGLLFDIDFTYKEMLDHYRERIVGQGEELEAAVYLIYEYLVKISRGEKKAVISWMLTAPSGSGKTEFFRVTESFIREHRIPVPVIRTDLSQITETGYKGKNIDKFIGELREKTSSETNNAAIAFLDEADKKFVPSITSGGINVNAAIQSNLLTMAEGSEMTDDDSNLFDTSNIMFIFSGAFQKKREQKKKLSQLMLDGMDHDESEVSDCIYDNIGISDMVEAGMISELAGRMKMVINFRKVPPEDMKIIIRDKCTEIGRQHLCRTGLTEKAVDAFLGVAYTDLGVRQVINSLEEIVIRTITRKLSRDGFDAEKDIIVIDDIDKAHISHNGKAEKTAENNN